MNRPLGILILAAGRSSRMGQPKTLLPWADSTVVETVIQTAKHLPESKIAIVSGASHKQLSELLADHQVEIIQNQDWQQGMGSSLALGIKHFHKKQVESVLVLLADMPTVSFDHLKRLVQSFNAQDCDVVCSRYKDNSGVPAVFSLSTFDRLMCLEGEIGAKKLLNTASWRLVYVDSLTPFEDIDTPEAYQKLKEKYNA